MITDTDGRWTTWPDDIEEGPDTGVACSEAGYWLEVMPSDDGWRWTIYAPPVNEDSEPAFWGAAGSRGDGMQSAFGAFLYLHHGAPKSW